MIVEDNDATPDPTPAPEAPAPAAEPSAPPPVLQAAPDDTDMDPADLVDAEKARGLIGAVKSLREQTKELKAKASEAENLRGQVAQLQGALQTFQHLKETLRQPQAPAPAAPQADPQLERIARSLDFYKTDGTPNLERAAEHRELLRQEATEIAKQWVQPIQQQSYQQQAAANFQRALQVKSPDGRTPSPETLAMMWQNLPPELTADPRTAHVLGLLGLGLDVSEGKGANRLPAQPAPPVNPPLHTEGSGGTVRPRPQQISDFSRGVIAQRGMKEEDYVKHTKDFRPGRATVLED